MTESEDMGFGRSPARPRTTDTQAISEETSKAFALAATNKLHSHKCLVEAPTHPTPPAPQTNQLVEVWQPKHMKHTCGKEKQLISKI